MLWSVVRAPFALGAGVFCSAALLSTAMLMPPTPANAAPGDELCALMQAQARAICLAGTRAVRAAPAAPYRPPTPVPAPGFGATRAAATAPAAAAAGFTRLNVVGNLYVDVAGQYPDGYGGKWNGVGVTQSIPVGQTWFVNRGEAKSSIQQPATLATPDGAGPAQFGFVVRGKTCYADLGAGGGPIVLSEAPRTFRLTNLHTVEPAVSGCVISNTINSFSGSLTLSANSRGDVFLQYTLDVYNAQGVQQYRWESAEVQLKNAMTPDQAATDLIKKREIATAQATADAQRRADAAAQEAKDTADRKAADDILKSLPPARGR